MLKEKRLYGSMSYRNRNRLNKLVLLETTEASEPYIKLSYNVSLRPLLISCQATPFREHYLTHQDFMATSPNSPLRS